MLYKLAVIDEKSLYSSQLSRYTQSINKNEGKVVLRAKGVQS